MALIQLFSVVVDPETIQGTLVAKWEYNLKAMPVLYREPFIHSFTVGVSSPAAGMFLEGKSKPQNE